MKRTVQNRLYEIDLCSSLLTSSGMELESWVRHPVGAHAVRIPRGGKGGRGLCSLAYLTYPVHAGTMCRSRLSSGGRGGVVHIDNAVRDVRQWVARLRGMPYQVPRPSRFVSHPG